MANFYGYQETGKIAEKVWKIGRMTGDTKTIDADEIGLNLKFDYLMGVNTDWTPADSAKNLMIKVTPPAANLTGRIHVRKMTKSEKSNL